MKDSNGRYCKEVALCKFRPQTDTYYSNRKICQFITSLFVYLCIYVNSEGLMED